MHTLSDITAVILAGGAGTRLREILPDIPKTLADINGRPFISILLDRLGHFGIRRVVVCTGHLGRKVRDNLGNSHGAISLIYSHEHSPLDTAGALGHARHLLPAGPALVINGDSYCHTDLKRFYAWFQGKAVDAAMVLAYVADTGRFGRVEIDTSGYVVSFHEKTPGGGPGWINAGIYLIDRSIIETIPGNMPCSLEKDVFPGLCGSRLAGFTTRDAFLDIGTREAFHSAPDFFMALESQS